MSVIVHVIFYAALIKLDSWAMQVIASGRSQVSTREKLIELAPPPERSTLRTAPEPLERADINRLQFDPAQCRRRSPGSTIPEAIRAPRNRRPPPSSRSDRKANAHLAWIRHPRTAWSHNPSSATSRRDLIHTGQSHRRLDEAAITRTPPTQAVPMPPAPSRKQEANTSNSGGSEAAPADPAAAAAPSQAR